MSLATSIYHNHHITPKYLLKHKSKEFINDSSNIISLTTIEHSYIHLWLYRLLGNNEDLYASKILFKIKDKTLNDLSGENNLFFGKTHSEETKQKMSDNHHDYNGSNNPNYNNKWSNEQKNVISKQNKGKLTGDKNPSKRLEVRKLISESKLGAKNPQSKKWIIISPTGEIIKFTGGIKSKLKEMGLSYSGAWSHLKGNTDNYNGWTINYDE